jgi:regulator of replication initiation timing
VEKTVQELKTIIREMILELGDLKERLRFLEEEIRHDNKEEPTPKIQAIPLIEGEAYEKLGKIYNEGYHICHMAYGQRRDGECLFCIAFLEKE